MMTVMPPRSLGRYFGFLLLVLQFGSIALGGTIQVLIQVLPHNSQVESIRITLTLVRGGSFRRTVTLTDRRSHAFSGIRAGSYSIRAESPGFQTVVSQVELNSFARADHELTHIALKKLDEEKSALSTENQTTVSVKALGLSAKAQQQMDKAHRASGGQNHKKAIKHLLKAIQIDPASYQAYNNLAVEYVRIGKVQEAIEALRQSIDLEPQDATTRRNLAELYLAVGMFNEALGALGTSSEIEPGNAKTGMLFGMVYLGLQEYQTALTHFERAAAQSSDHHAYLGMALCYLTLGQTDLALEEFKGFVKQNPEDPRVGTARETIAHLELQLKEEAN